MAAVTGAADRAGFPEEARHLEYFAVPEEPDYVNHPFRIRVGDGPDLMVAENQTIADVLNANGHTVDVKCSDGICGVCKCTFTDGDVEHRDFVLSKAQRQTEIITCRSRAAKSDGVLTIKL